MRNAFVETLCTLMSADKKIYLLTGDLGFGVLTKFYEVYPENFINVGIAEQNMTAVAAGLALEGNTVFTYSMPNFGLLRCLEQIRCCVAYPKVNVKIVSVGAGRYYGALGITHHSTEDLSVARAIPNMAVFSPADVYEAIAVTKAAYRLHEPCYIRLSGGHDPLIHSSEIFDYEIGKAIKILDGDDCAIFSTGAISVEALKAAQNLNVQGISTALFTFPTVKPIDIDVIKKYACRCKMIVTVEENNIVGGFGSAVAEIISGIKDKKAFQKLFGINDEFTNVVGSQDYLRGYYKLKEEYVFEMVSEEFSNLSDKMNGGGVF